MGEAKIHLCFECGQKNRVPVGAEAAALCGGCGKKLYPNLTATAPATTPERTYKAPEKSGGWGAAAWLLGLTLVPTLLLAVYYNSGVGADSSNYAEYNSGALIEPTATSNSSASGYFDAPSGNEEASTDQYVEVIAPELVAQSFSPGLAWNLTNRAKLAPLYIVTQPGQKYFVKLVELPSMSDAVGILVQGGEDIEVAIPLGTYEMRWCSGYTWYGETDRFGPAQTCSKAEEIFRFELDGTTPVGYTVELIEQLGGNLDTNEIDPSAF